MGSERCIRDSAQGVLIMQRVARSLVAAEVHAVDLPGNDADQCDFAVCTCLLYTSDAADERSSVDLGGRRIIKKKTHVTPG